ncbi:MAG: L-histidine N(alpha)-methyltransferase [Pseudomonadota bacterium]|nr:L-histidine N(alpha)-methyltransferase [Pseudomonadota bacterium]
MNSAVGTAAKVKRAASTTAFQDAVISGLSRRQKAIPPRFLYDSRGSELFEQITTIPEYYPTRTEIGLLKARGREIRQLVGECHSVVEFGSGSSTKTPLILEGLAPSIYVPIDISETCLFKSAAAVAARYPDIEVMPVAGDFMQPLRAPQRAFVGRTLGFFPGSTLGNFDHSEAVDLLRAFAATLGSDSVLLIGIDLLKNPRCIEVAYDDAAGVTAAFNLNLIDRINRELGGNIKSTSFEHQAIWNDQHHRIEMHLVAKEDMEFSAAERQFSMRCGESIHTENSYKYSLEEIRLMARVSGWEPQRIWVDENHLFSLSLWKR